MTTIECKVPDIGGYDDVPVIEVLVAVGDRVEVDQGLVTLESDKATMEVPSSAAGIVRELKVKLGDTVSEGSLVAVLEVEGADASTGVASPEATAAAAEKPASQPAPAAASVAAPSAAGESGRKADVECNVLVLGAGPGGYTAAFRAADLDLDTVLVERYPSLGGVCLNVGCIPSKALLHAANVIDEVAHAGDYGIDFGKPKITLDKLRAYKEKVVGQLTKGLAGMAKQRKVRVETGTGRFISPNELEVEHDGATRLIRFRHCIIAAGSQAVKLPMFPWDDPRVMDSTDALDLSDVPARLLVVGGGIIGLEMATVYRALGSEVTVVELMDQLMPGADIDLVRPLAKRLKDQGVNVHLKTKVVEAKAQKNGIRIGFEGDSEPEAKIYDRVLVSVGRAPNGGKIGADKAGVSVTDRGFIPVDRQMRSNVPHIFAIGDLVGNPMLAHKATHEGKLAAEVIAGAPIVVGAPFVLAGVLHVGVIVGVGGRRVRIRCRRRRLRQRRGCSLRRRGAGAAGAPEQAADAVGEQHAARHPGRRRHRLAEETAPAAPRLFRRLLRACRRHGAAKAAAVPRCIGGTCIRVR